MNAAIGTTHRTSDPLGIVAALCGVAGFATTIVLWLAQLHPLRSSDSLDDDEVARLYSGIRLALLQGIEHGGSTLRDYRNSYGQSGSNQEHFNVYDQEGKPCPRCGTPIEKIVVGQRGTHFCPFCQRIAPFQQQRG